MTWKDNMKIDRAAEIKDYDGDDYTKITFRPDFKKFHQKNLSDDMVYDLAGILDKKVHVVLNGKRIKMDGFKDYVDLYQLEQSADYTKVHETINNRWEVVVSVSEGQFFQSSFVNGICTLRGGTHVDYVVDQLTSKITEQIKRKNKDLNVKPFQVKNNLAVFVNCLIENPSFDSQTKETLMTKKENFGSECELSEKFLKGVVKSGVLDFIVSQARAKERVKVQKALSGKKATKVLGIPKLEDANLAGTKDSGSCLLILTEGDSAKALAMAGLGVVGRDKYGVFPLRGKLLNVRDAGAQVLKNNTEIQAVVKILGLKFDTDYEDTDSLRYGGILIMADQDHDGSHIKGLIINFIHYFWPSLIKLNKFMKEFVTPVIKVSQKGEPTQSFFTINDYKRWIEEKGDHSKLSIKYYKGLGTSTNDEAREYFKNISKHVINFQYSGKADDSNIDLAFSKSKADDRKRWIDTAGLNDTVDHSRKNLTYSDFINKELVQYSIASNARAIPSVIDGLKPGQRKIMFACFKRKLKNEIKVAQLSGYVAEHSAYHHGEMSLCMTIVNLAQDYIGSNNINLLMPLGQFGTRSLGGKDSASPRYIFTKLSPLTRLLYPEVDDNLLNYLEDDGLRIEPDFYVPILPMILINGATGIGMGWSTFVPCYNPLDLVDSIKKLLNNQELKPISPWYFGFRGTITQYPKTPEMFITTGCYKMRAGGALEITELPVGTWTSDYKDFLENMMQGDKDSQKINEIREYHNRGAVRFMITFKNDYDSELADNCEKKMKLSSTLSQRNMVLFDKNGKIKRYDSVLDIIHEFYGTRLQLYTARKQYIISKIQAELTLLENRVRFVTEILQGKLQINNKKKADLELELQEMGYSKLGGQSSDANEDSEREE